MNQTKPSARLLRLKDIVGDKKRNIPSLIPVSKSTWWAGVRSGRYPAPVYHLGKRITTWRESDILTLVNGGANHNEEGTQ